MLGYLDGIIGISLKNDMKLKKILQLKTFYKIKEKLEL